MNKYFDKAFDKFDECMKTLENAMKFEFKEKIKSGAKIKIKKGSTVFLGKNVYATLSEDVEAIVK